MRHLGTLSLIVCLAAASGCNICCWGKRASELGSPTDIRQSHYWCLGEDAVFHQPCGPSRNDYGLKPTCWREWPADGGRCVEGSCPGGNCTSGGCSPTLSPALPMQNGAPPVMWEESVPTEAGQGPNPFRDDAEPLPAPTGQGPRINRPIGPPQSKSNSKPPATTVRTAPERTTNEYALPAPRVATAKRPTVVNGPLKPATRASEVPRAIPASLQLEAPRTPPATPRPLKITVAPPIDTPVRYLAPVVAPPAVNTPAAQAATLASLEQMIEVPTAGATTSTGAAIVRNDFARQPQPFRLATRDSLADKDDPQLERKTLSALQSMMSSDAPAAR